ncbi:hypothetical protein Tco_0020182 [Tanacetum coccineum]
MVEKCRSLCLLDLSGEAQIPFSRTNPRNHRENHSDKAKYATARARQKSFTADMKRKAQPMEIPEFIYN